MSRKKCIIILSEKSSGSSALQNLLTVFAKIKHVDKTRHNEHETLYWTKAASILDLPQLDILDSEVPIAREKAKFDLITLLRDNLDNYSPPNDDQKLVVDGWRLLCEKYTPIFLEKSPHHLCQWSAIELIIECIRELDDIDFLLIGLIRNPMDTMYSQFKRWQASPEKLQHQWYIAYHNLLKLKEIMGEKLIILRYEDITSSVAYLLPVFSFCDLSIDTVDQSYLHQTSILKWKQDKMFSFMLANKVANLARKYGYKDEEIINKANFL